MVTEGTFLPARRTVSWRHRTRQGRSQSSRHFVMAQAPPLTATAPYRNPAPIRHEGTTTASEETHTSPRGKECHPVHPVPLSTPSSQVTATRKEHDRHKYGTRKWAAGNKEHAGNSHSPIPDTAIYSYNLGDSKTPDGLKVR